MHKNNRLLTATSVTAIFVKISHSVVAIILTGIIPLELLHFISYESFSQYLEIILVPSSHYHVRP